MIWLIGNRGMLGSEVEALLKGQQKDYFASDQEVDITNREQIWSFLGDRPVDWIINCAAYTAVDRAEEEPDLAYWINADGPFHIAEAAREKGAKLIHISTDYVFAGTSSEAYGEDSAAQPLGVYGESKHRGEQNILAALSSHFIIRTAWMYGKKGQNFVATMLRLFGEKDELKVVADQWGSPTYAPDLAEMILHIVSTDSEAYGIYHITNDGCINWHEFASEIYRLAKRKGLIERDLHIAPVSTDQYPTRARRPAFCYLSKEKICREFGVTLKPWKESLEKFLDQC